MTDKLVPLTKKTARQLVEKYMALPPRRIDKDLDAGGDVRVYIARFGAFTIVVENDWYTRNGLLSTTIRLPNGHSVCSYYDPKTLEKVETKEYSPDV